MSHGSPPPDCFLQLVDEMNQANVGWGVWTCYTTYLLVRRTGSASFTISDIVLRDRDSDGIRPYVRSSVAKVSPLQLLLGLVFLPTHANREDADLGWWVKTGDVVVGASYQKKRRRRHGDLDPHDGGGDSDGDEPMGGQGGAAAGAGERQVRVAEAAGGDDFGGDQEGDSSNDSIERIKTPQDSFFPNVRPPPASSPLKLVM